MKIVIVTNPDDNALSVPKAHALDKLTTEKGIRAEAEVHMVDANQVRDVLPISSTPCVFVLFDELSDDFDPQNLPAILDAVKARKLAKGKRN